HTQSTHTKQKQHKTKQHHKQHNHHPHNQPNQPQAAAPKAYKKVLIKLPEPVADPSFATFRQQLTGIAEKKDRAALGRILSQKFFWIPEGKDVAEKNKSAIDNLSKAIGLDGQDPPGWDLLAGYASEPTAEP